MAAFELILIGPRKMVGGSRPPSGQKLPPRKAFMDDITSLLPTVQAVEESGRADVKSQSLSLQKGARNDCTIFAIGGGKTLHSRALRQACRKSNDKANKQMASHRSTNANSQENSRPDVTVPHSTIG